MRARAMTLVAAFSGLVVLGSCMKAAETNLSPVHLHFEPTLSAFKDPDTDFSQYRTFSVFPASLLYEDASSNAIQEKQVLFFLRSLVESRGYEFVELDEDPDILLTIHVSSSYKETYVPPSTRTVLGWVHGKTITTTGTSTGTVGGWGSYMGTTKSTTRVPGHLTTNEITTPGRTVGHFYPGVMIEAVENDSLYTIWYGTGVGTSDNHDVRISGQAVARRLFARFPECRFFPSNEGSHDAFVGIAFVIYTVEGNSYYPAVLEVLPRSPAKLVRVDDPSMKRGLREHDLITAIDGVSTENMSFAQVADLLAGDSGTVMTLEILRLDKVLRAKLTRGSRAEYEKREARRRRWRR